MLGNEKDLPHHPLCGRSLGQGDGTYPRGSTRAARRRPHLGSNRARCSATSTLACSSVLLRRNRATSGGARPPVSRAQRLPFRPCPAGHGIAHAGSLAAAGWPSQSAGSRGSDSSLCSRSDSSLCSRSDSLPELQPGLFAVFQLGLAAKVPAALSFPSGSCDMPAPGELVARPPRAE